MRLGGGFPIVVFYRSRLDPLMRTILDPAEPFHTSNPHKKDSNGRRENYPEPLPHLEMPAGLMELL